MVNHESISENLRVQIGDEQVELPIKKIAVTKEIADAINMFNRLVESIKRFDAYGDGDHPNQIIFEMKRLRYDTQRVERIIAEKLLSDETLEVLKAQEKLKEAIELLESLKKKYDYL